MKSWVMKKKRSNRQRKKTYYDDLPIELQTNILKRLPRKDLSRVMCVSKSWFNHILYTIFPIFLFSTFPFMKLLQRVKSKAQREIPSSWISVFIDALALEYSSSDLNQLITWCTKVADYRFAARKLIDSCNGLFLFSHKSWIQNHARAVYRYYVVDPISKNYMAILKPRPGSTPYTYVALAYDPTESEIFKIIGFQGSHHVNIFSSGSHAWSRLQFCLPWEVLTAKWLKNSIYLNGAIYRLSTSGHLIKFLVNQQEDPHHQALAIRIPSSNLLSSCYKDIGLKHKKVVLFTSVGSCLTIWELVEHFDGDVYSFNWCQTHRVIDNFIRDLNGCSQLFAIHPYYPIAFFKADGIVYYYFYCHNTKDFAQEMGKEGDMYRYITTSGLLLLSYLIPRCFDKKHQGRFQWLPTIEDTRVVEVYTLED